MVSAEYHQYAFATSLKAHMTDVFFKKFPFELIGYVRRNGRNFEKSLPEMLHDIREINDVYICNMTGLSQERVNRINAALDDMDDFNWMTFIFAELGAEIKEMKKTWRTEVKTEKEREADLIARGVIIFPRRKRHTFGR